MTLHLRNSAIAILIAVFSFSAVAAGTTDDATALMAKGQYQDALKLLDQQVARNPQDAQARFARGIALTQLKRTTDAMKVFSDLTRDYPQLPEPYNNLAVLYAQQGDYDKAREALQAALATHPGYATAHENLGDIYSALAGAAYNRALALDKDNSSVRSKLNLINQIEQTTSATAMTAGAPAQPAPAAAAAAAEATAPAPAAAVTPSEPAAAAPAAAQATTAVDEATTSAVNAALQAWANAWSNKDLPAYFAAYGADFTPEGAQSRAAWKQQRTERITKPAHISVKIKDVAMTQAAPDRMSVSFTQDYASDSFSDSVGKVLDLARSGDNWKIVREYTR
ncbi:MAG: tetratricopeptide repeat protein [Stenotrophobium sp.]